MWINELLVFKFNQQEDSCLDSLIAIIFYNLSPQSVILSPLLTLKYMVSINLNLNFKTIVGAVNIPFKNLVSIL